MFIVYGEEETVVKFVTNKGFIWYSSGYPIVCLTEKQNRQNIKFEFFMLGIFFKLLK